MNFCPIQVNKTWVEQAGKLIMKNLKKLGDRLLVSRREKMEYVKHSAGSGSKGFPQKIEIDIDTDI